MRHSQIMKAEASGESHPHGDSSNVSGKNPDTDQSASSDRQLREIANDLTRFQVRCLAVLAEDSRIGLDIKADLDAYYETEVNHGRLYPNLNTLIDRGLVERTARDRRSYIYSLTDLGAAVLEFEYAWLDSKVTGGGQ